MVKAKKLVKYLNTNKGGGKGGSSKVKKRKRY